MVWIFQVLIDGPYGAPTQDIFEAEHAVLIAAGIGITPFASILQSIMCRYRNLRHKCPNCDYIWDNPQNSDPFVKKVFELWMRHGRIIAIHLGRFYLGNSRATLIGMVH